MTENNDASTKSEALPNLKVLESEVSVDTPWHDDVLNREEIAERLTNLVRTQSVPFVVSVHGAWGTGKTFMLKRWQKALEGECFQAIYFNAWDDDFCEDPLIAIIGQLSDYLNDSKYSGIKKEIETATNSLIRRSSLTLSVGVASITTPLDNGRDDKDLLQVYLEQRETKDTLKKHLEELSAKVLEDTGHPLVFIIDELDRCRPTFAIELLERVKHVFDVPGLAFVFGINHDELCKSLKSVYGEINADIYLRRFFDMEFTLPEADTENFCRHMFERFRLREFFASKSEDARSNIHIGDYDYLSGNFPKLWAELGLSLRDIDYCVRLVALIGKNVDPQRSMYPQLIGLLIPLKFVSPTLYREYVRGECTGSKVMNYIDEKLPVRDSDRNMSNFLNIIEAYLYLADSRFDSMDFGGSPSLVQLDLLSNNEELTAPHYLTKRTLSSDQNRIMRLKVLTGPIRETSIPPSVVAYLAELIDLHQNVLRR